MRALMTMSPYCNYYSFEIYFRAGTVAEQANPLLEAPVLVQVPTGPLPLQLPADGLFPSGGRPNVLGFCTHCE